MQTLPMFPLGTVMLPGGVMPLHVFEPRYRQMMADILADDDHAPEFGIVLIERGHEVGGGDVRSAVGTVARIVDINVLPDGRFALVAVGRERIKVVEWLPDDPYPRAVAEEWPDTDAGEVDLDAARSAIADLHARVDTLNADLRVLGEQVPDPATQVSDNPHLAAYHLAALAPLGPVDRLRMLQSPGLEDRLRVLESALEDAAAVVRFRSS